MIAAGEEVRTNEGDIGIAEGLAAKPGYLSGERGVASDVREGSFNGSAFGAFLLRGFKEVTPPLPLTRGFALLEGTLNLGVGDRIVRAKVLGENGDASADWRRSMMDPSIPNAAAVGGAGERILGVVGAAAIVATSLASALVALRAVAEKVVETGESGLIERPREAAIADLENMIIVSRYGS